MCLEHTREVGANLTDSLHKIDIIKIELGTSWFLFTCKQGSLQ